MNKQRKYEKGQAMVEFAVVIAMMLGVCLTMMFMLSVFTEYGWRIVSLVALPYP
jgi:hypothetical protein